MLELLITLSSSNPERSQAVIIIVVQSKRLQLRRTLTLTCYCVHVFMAPDRIVSQLNIGSCPVGFRCPLKSERNHLYLWSYLEKQFAPRSASG